MKATKPLKYRRGRRYKNDRPKDFPDYFVVRRFILRELASRLGLSVGYIADMENGRRNWNQTKVELWNHAIQKKHGHYPGF